MKVLKLTSFIISVIMLSACSGGGSGHSDKSMTKLESINKLEPTKQVNSVEKVTETINDKLSENPAVIKQDNPIQQKEKIEFIKPEKTSKETAYVAPSKESRTNIKLIDNHRDELRMLPIGKVENEDLGFGTVTGYNNKYSFNGAWKEKKDKAELTDVIVDNIKVELAGRLAGIGGIKGVLLGKFIESVFNSSDSDDSQRDVFYFGSETPISIINQSKGNAFYKGNATRYDNIKKEVSNVGNSILKVDFDNKKINGELQMNGLRRNIALKETDIVGNGFKGEAVAGENSLLITRKGQYEGKFFGPNAEEISGKAFFTGEAIWGKLQDLDTSFSAEKQK